MKNRFLLILPFLLVFLFSCKSDDEGNDPTQANKKALGTSAVDLLSDSKYKKLVVEVVYPEGFQPQSESINNLTAFLNERVNKPGGIQIIERQISTPAGSSFTIEDIRAIEDANRTFYNDQDQIAVYIFFSNQSSANDTSQKITVGTAYRNTSIVVYEKTIRSFDTSSTNLVFLESTTMQHEFGHLFGLVNVQLDDIHQVHEDTDSNKHCFMEDCIMYFQTTANRTVFKNAMNNKSAIKQMDILCREDMAAKGGK